MVNLGSIALLSNSKVTTFSGKHLEIINHADIVSVMYKLITSSKNSDDLSIRFDADRNRSRLELTNNKNLKSKYDVRNMLKDVLGFAVHQQKATYVLR